MAGTRSSTIRHTLDDHGQGHLLRFYDELDAAAQASLVDQLATIDFAGLRRLIDAPDPAPPPTAAIAPAPFYPAPGRTRAPAPARTSAIDYDPAPYRHAGVEMVRAGKVAAFTVAGGQGTRLGWSGPKGTYPATPVTGKPLFRCFAEQIFAAQAKYATTIPWYIMTSPENDAVTRAFFVDNNCFGLARKNIFMFPQGVMPAVDDAGKLLLARRDRVAVSPDGHGGSIKALLRSGALEDMAARGIEQISYFQVDNPLVRVIDPLFLGLHAGAPDSSGEMSSKIVEKTVADEKLGVFVRVGGGGDAARTAVIEYSELPETLANDRDQAGGLRYAAGSIAVHLMSVPFVGAQSASEWDQALPYHRARKIVPYVDDAGTVVEPDAPNATKFETFVFDALAVASSSIVFETERSDEFAPIKNMRGADSPATSHRLQIERAARWLEANGVEVPRGADGQAAAQVEIGALTALEPGDLASAELPPAIAAGAAVAL